MPSLLPCPQVRLLLGDYLLPSLRPQKGSTFHGARYLPVSSAIEAPGCVSESACASGTS